jgi:hypothetical protein
MTMSDSQTPWALISTVMAAIITAVTTIVVALINHWGQPQPPPSQGGQAQVLSAAETPKLSGHWHGSFSQQTASGMQRIYSLEMKMSQEGGTITGEAREIIANSNYFADVGITGQLGQGRTVTLQDVVFHRGFPARGWCAKTAGLQVSADGDTLDGTWQAPSCSGGTMHLQRR